MLTLRDRALAKIAQLSPEVVEAIAIVIETAEVQGGYVFDGEGSVWEDDVSYTLNELAREIRKLLKNI
jgi:hypothetical protein